MAAGSNPREFPPALALFFVTMTAYRRNTTVKEFSTPMSSNALSGFAFAILLVVILMAAFGGFGELF